MLYAMTGRERQQLRLWKVVEKISWTLYISPFDGQMVTVGVKHLQFYPYRNGQVGKGKKARSIRSTVIGVTATSKGIWVGVSGGHLMLFVGGRMRTTKKNVHKGKSAGLAYHETLERFSHRR